MRNFNFRQIREEPRFRTLGYDGSLEDSRWLHAVEQHELHTQDEGALIIEVLCLVPG